MQFGQHPYPGTQTFQYPPFQQNYMGLLNQQPGMAQTPTSQAYPANLAGQRPGLYPQSAPTPAAGPGPQAGGVGPGSWQGPQGSGLASLPMSQQGTTPASMAQLGVAGAGNPMQGMFLRPGHSPLPQGGMLHQFPLNAQSPHLAGQQQAGIPGLRPASFLQATPQLSSHKSS